MAGQIHARALRSTRNLARVATGIPDPLFILAIDRRAGLARDLLGATHEHAPDVRERLVAAKATVAEGFELAVETAGRPCGAGLLVDEEFGADLARRARERGELLAMPAERAGLDWFEPEYGDDFATHIEAFDAPFVKVLVRHNPDGDSEHHRRSIVGLGRIARWVADHGRHLLLELIVPATPHQLAEAGSETAYDRDVRPALAGQVIAMFQAAGIEADVWKLEGFDRRDDAWMVSEQIRAGGRDHVGYVVLGRGAPEARVDHWLRTSAGVPGCRGFAIGRSIWRDPIVDELAGHCSHADAVEAVARNYLRAIEVFTS